MFSSDCIHTLCNSSVTLLPEVKRHQLVLKRNLARQKSFWPFNGCPLFWTRPTKWQIKILFSKTSYLLERLSSSSIGRTVRFSCYVANAKSLTNNRIVFKKATIFACSLFFVVCIWRNFYVALIYSCIYVCMMSCISITYMKADTHVLRRFFFPSLVLWYTSSII